jgi:hypothetical protein
MVAVKLPLEKSRLFADGGHVPEPRLEAWLPYAVAALFPIALALLFADAFLGWTESVVKGAEAQK